MHDRPTSEPAPNGINSSSSPSCCGRSLLMLSFISYLARACSFSRVVNAVCAVLTTILSLYYFPKRLVIHNGVTEKCVSPGKIQHTVFLSFCEKNKKIKKIKKNRELDGQTADF